MTNDELNLITTYFDEMEIKDKEKRKTLCLDLFPIFFYIFALIQTDLTVEKLVNGKNYLLNDIAYAYGFTNASMGSPKTVDTYKKDLKERFHTTVSESPYKEVFEYPYIANKIDKTLDNLVDTTVANGNNAYFGSKERAIKVAQDITNVVANNLELEEMKAKGFKYKTWYSILDNVTRQSHWLAWGQTVPIDEPFIVGGVKMICPCDCNAPAEEVANCRCTMTYSNSETPTRKPDDNEAPTET